jgi:hypothetical protein
MNKIRPTTTPAIPHFKCGDMLTPIVSSRRALRIPPGRPSCL